MSSPWPMRLATRSRGTITASSTRSSPCNGAGGIRRGRRERHCVLRPLAGMHARPEPRRSHVSPSFQLVEVPAGPLAERAALIQRTAGQ